MSDRGYPTEEELKKITEWPHDNFKGLMNFVHDLWEYANCGYWTQNELMRPRSKKYYISTGGWSGNEDIIQAMQNNDVFWTMCWQQSKRGGHYTFRVR